MELEFSCFTSIILSFLLSVFMLLKLLRNRSKFNHKGSNLPPGPWKLPLMGNLHQLFGDLPHHRLRDLARKHGPLMHLQLGEVSAIVVSSPEFAKEVMKTHDTIFASRPQDVAAKILSYDFTDITFSPYGDYWRQLRRICTLELLCTKRVQSFRSVREEEASNFIDSIALQAGSVINLTDKVNSLMYCIVSRAAFGNKCKEQELFISAVKELQKLLAIFNIADLFPSIGLLQYITGIRSQAERMHREADKIVESIINDHKKRKVTQKIDQIEDDEDLLDVLLKHQEHGDHELPLTTDNIKAVILDILSGGSDSSSSTLDWAMCEMMKNPRVMKKAQAEVREVFDKRGEIDETSIDEMKILKLVIKETLRLHPPGPLLLPRECSQTCEINGFSIPIKAKVVINAWAIGRDPKYWNEPESFIPERFLNCSADYKGTNFSYIPFGAGRRVCPGISFALASVELPLAMLLYHFDWELPDGMKLQDLDMTEAVGVAGKKKYDTHMIPIPYHPSCVA